MSPSSPSNSESSFISSAVDSFEDDNSKARDDDDMSVDDDSDASAGVNRHKRRKTRKDEGKGKEKEKDGGKKDNLASWESSLTRTWDTVQEDEHGMITNSIEGLLASRRRRAGEAVPLRRTIIRHVVVLLDLSESMLERDLRPSRFDLALEYLKEFVVEWFDQNPLGQIGIIGLRSGLAERLVEMCGNPQDILRVLGDKKALEPAGEPSLQNGLEMAKNSMSHLPTHSSREVLLLLASLTSCDPGSISSTINQLINSKIRVSVVSLAAETKLAKDLATKTGGTLGVALSEGHLKDIMWESIPPPALKSEVSGQAGQKSSTMAKSSAQSSDLMMMGFPTRLPTTGPLSLCSCHGKLKSEGFLCPRCGSKICDVPTDCDVCGLLVVSSPHLARSYHHLFPVQAFGVVRHPLHPPSPPYVPTCHGCAILFPPLLAIAPATHTQVEETISPTGRYRCPKCTNHFCSDCDAFIHESLHVCPGCG